MGKGTKPVDESTVASIAAFVSQEDAALFIGSGISVWSGLPSWWTFIHRLIEHSSERGMRVGMAQAALADGRLLDAADALDIPPLEIASLLRNDLGFSAARPHDVHSLITQLGPQRYITTNYDTLIEQQLGLDGRLGHFRTVTASRVAEMADILKASADTFIFKAHGDIADAETMIVSAKDYERIMLGGQNLIRRGLETLLLSRPILFLGYGLRDPDLNLILRSLTDTFHGNIHHHVAIVAGLSEEEREYWWKRFRIRAFGYPVGRDHEGLHDHSALLDLLQAVILKGKLASERSSLSVTPELDNGVGPRARLMRYAASLLRDKEGATFRLIGRLRDSWDRWPDNRVTWLHNSELSTILHQCPVTLILEGHAGGGKSHAFADYLSSAATQILSSLSSDDADDNPPIPVLLDARLYEGSFAGLLYKSVPANVDLVAYSKTHRIDLIVDSLDEMPQAHLDDAAWRADLQAFASTFLNHRIIFGSRRAALVGMPSSPVFQIAELVTADVKDQMRAHGLSPDDFETSLISEVSSPFALSLILEFGSMVGQARSITALLSAAIDSYLSRLPVTIDRSAAQNLLRELAYEAVQAGRETITIEHVLTKLGHTQSGVLLVQSLVRCGLLISEVDAQVRFVHRSVTEYLCSSYILASAQDTSLNLETLLKNQRWDAPLTWALSVVGGEQAHDLLPTVFRFDPVLAYRIVIAAESDRLTWWSIFLTCLEKSPPTSEQMRAILHLGNADELPDDVIPALGALTATRSTQVRAWAWWRYAEHASDEELIAWLDQAAAGKFDFNEAQVTAPEIAQHLKGDVEAHFYHRLATLDWSEEDDEDSRTPKNDAENCYGNIVAGLTGAAQQRLLDWSEKQSDSVQAVICRGLLDSSGDGLYRYLVKRLDRGFYPACFSLYLRTRYAGQNRDGKLPVPRATARRVKSILGWLDKPKQARWAVSLLDTYVTRSSGWAKTLTEILPTVAPAVRKSVAQLLPGTTTSRRRAFVLAALKAPDKVGEIERAIIDTLGEKFIPLPEASVLESISNHGLPVVKLLDEWWDSSHENIKITVDTMDLWIEACAFAYPKDLWSREVSTTHLFVFLTRYWSISGREKILSRAEDPTDPYRDLLLSAFVMKLKGFSMAELSEVTSERLLDLYLSGHIDPYPSPGEVATDEFIENTVLPRRQTSDADEKDLLDLILSEAGSVLGRRFLADEVPIK